MAEKPTSCIVAEDSQMMRSLLRELVVKAGLKDCHTAADGLLALNLVEERVKAGKSVDVIIADWEMPNLDGLGFLRKAREVLGARPCAMLLVTTVKDPGSVGAAVEFGVDGYVLKPFRPDEFNKKLNAALAKKFPG